MRGLDVHENIDVSDTKLMLGLRVCSDLTANKLFPINPRAVTGPLKMSLLLGVESTSALIIEPDEVPCGLGNQNSANDFPCSCRKRRLIVGYKLSYTTGLLYAWSSCMQRGV